MSLSSNSPANRSRPTSGVFLAAVWLWGTVTFVLSLLLVVAVVSAIWYIDPSGHFSADVPDWVRKSYHVLQNLETLVGAIVGFGALAWAHFFLVINQR